MTAFRPSAAVTAWLLIGLLQGTSFGQAITGSISGTVEDPSGAAVPSANVTLIDAETRVERTTSLNDHGDFVFNSVPPGEYTIKVEASGFKTFLIPSINLTASEKLPLPKTVLQVGTTHDTVVVAADAAVVQTASAERSSVINSAQMDDLMTNGRTALSVVALIPGVVANGANYNVSGLRLGQINITSDGINIVEAGTRAIRPAPAISTFHDCGVIECGCSTVFSSRTPGPVRLTAVASAARTPLRPMRTSAFVSGRWFTIVISKEFPDREAEAFSAGRLCCPFEISGAFVSSTRNDRAP